MRPSSLIPLLALLLVPNVGLAATLAAWDFEDQDLIVDVTSPGNTTNAITSDGNGPSWSTSGNPGGTAASFSALTSAGQGFEVPFSATGASDVSIRFSLRPSNTANKWWKVEVSVGGGLFTALPPLVELTGETWSTHERALPSASGQANVVVRISVTDSNGDGTGEIERAAGTGAAPAAGGTVRIDDVVIETEEEEEEEEPPVDAGPLPPPPAITEVAWMGSESAAGDEWVELYNRGPDDIADLSRYVLIEGAAERALPEVPLPAGAIIVLEANANATSLGPPEAEVISLSLANGGEALRICPVGAETELDECDVANLGGAWPAGSNTSKRTMVRVDADLDGSLSSSWLTYEGPPSSVTDSTGAAILGTPGSYAPTVVEPPTDGGVIDDGGIIVPPDAGPNEPPSLMLLSPSGEVRVERELTITYEATDPDGDDTVSVALFYDTDDVGFDGVEIARGLPAAGSFTWAVTDVPAGTYSIFGVATDDRGEAAYAYAPGRAVVEGSGTSGGAILRVTDPDGVNDVVDGRVTVRWEVLLPEGEDGTISLYYDDDDEGEDGEPIIAGLPVRASDGGEGPRSYLWDPTGVPPGAYTVYAVLDWPGGSISAYSEFVTIGAEGCACGSTGGDVGSLFATALALLVLLVPRGRREERRRHKGPSC